MWSILSPEDTRILDKVHQRLHGVDADQVAAFLPQLLEDLSLPGLSATRIMDQLDELLGAFPTEPASPSGPQVTLPRLAQLYLHFGGAVPVRQPEVRADTLPAQPDGGGDEDEEEDSVIVQLRRTFAALDFGGQGRLTQDALERQFGQHATAWEINDFIQERDTSGKGYVDFDDWVEYFDKTGEGLSASFGGTSRRQNPGAPSARRFGDPEHHPSDHEDMIRKAFATYDIDGDGVISFSELKAVLTKQHSQISDSDIRAWIQRRDKSKLGGVSYRDFRDAYMGRI